MPTPGLRSSCATHPSRRGRDAMSPRTRGALAVVFAAASWGCWSLLLRPTGLPGSVTAPIMLGGIALLSVPLWREDPRPRWTGRAVLILVAYALSDALNAGTFFSAMQVGTVAVAVLTHSLGPVLVALAAPVVTGVRTRGAVPAAVVALVGIALVIEPWRPDALSGSPGLGAALGLASAVGYAGGVLTAGKLAPVIGPARTLGMHAALSALVLLPFALPHVAEVEARDLVPLLLAILVPGLLAGMAFVRALGAIGTARAAVIALLEPLVACVVGWLVFGEHLGVTAAIGGALVLGAAAYVATALSATAARAHAR